MTVRILSGVVESRAVVVESRSMSLERREAMGMGAEEEEVAADAPNSAERRGLWETDTVGEDLVEEDPVEKG